MIKKLIVTSAAVALAGAFFFGRDVVSYARTGAKCVKRTVRDSVPVHFEFQRAKNMVEHLDPEIRRNMHMIAKEEVDIDRLQAQIAKLDQAVQHDRTQLTRLSGDLQEGEVYLVYSGRRYSPEQVKADMALRLKRVKTNDTTLHSLQKVLTARQSRLESARAKLEQTLALKRQAMVEIENLMSRQKMVEVAETANQLAISFDESSVSRLRDLLDELSTRIEVSERMVDASEDYRDEIPIETDEQVDVMQEVASYLNQGQPEIASVAEIN
jgi:chromosome segregation ATPase